MSVDNKALLTRRNFLKGAIGISLLEASRSDTCARSSPARQLQRGASCGKPIPL